MVIVDRSYNPRNCFASYAGGYITVNKNL